MPHVSQTIDSTVEAINAGLQSLKAGRGWRITVHDYGPQALSFRPFGPGRLLANRVMIVPSNSPN